MRSRSVGGTTMGKENNAEVLAPRTTEYEFNGPLGALGVVIGLPVTVYLLYFACGVESCLGIAELPAVLDRIPLDARKWVSTEAVLVVAGWMAFQAVLAITLPGPIVRGVKLRDGSSLTYKLNGFSALCVTVLMLAASQYFGYISLAWLGRAFAQLATVALLLSFGLSAYLYATSFVKGRMLAAGGNTGNAIYDFFIGRELNPRIGSFDLKEFCELKPGLIGWVVLNAGFAAMFYEEHGFVSSNLILVNAFQFLYVADALWFERAILTTMDITTDGFGFMLVFGDLVWVPFTYTMQARYLATVPDAPHQLSNVMLTTILAMKLVGYCVFRGANGQKDRFRTNPNDPSVAHLKTLKTKRGTQLLISGWWGVVRHPNYVGDWLMAWSWCLPCGFQHVLPWFYVIYFCILLIHREIRDEHSCEKKYGDDWKKYCSIVRYRLVPGVF